MKLYDFKMKTIQGQEKPLADYQGKALLIVNVASKCGLTPQYEGLEKIYEQYRERGLEVLGFPANEFLAQEPGSDADIQEFCTTNFGVKFPMFSKIVVKGEGQHPLYKFLTGAQPKALENPDSGFKERLKSKNLLTGSESDIAWNFEKFLVDRKGAVIARFAPDVKPDDAQVTQAIEKALV